jgi:predicted dinucleotide-binding enzyme
VRTHEQRPFRRRPPSGTSSWRFPFGQYRELPTAAIGGKIVIRASNYYPDRDGEIDLQGRTQTELLADHLADAWVAKTFNTMYWETLRDEARPTAHRDDRFVLFVAGDDEESKERRERPH